MSAATLPASDVLVICATHDFLASTTAQRRFVDPIWEAVRSVLGATGRPQPYLQGAQFLAELRAHANFLESKDRFFRLWPRLRDSVGVPASGVFQTAKVGTKTVCLLSCDLRLGTDGPTTPVLRLLPLAVDEARPKLVVHVGLGCGTRTEHQAGDVVVSNLAQFFLRGELQGLAINGGTFGGAWTPNAATLGTQTFAQLQEPALLPPSPHYENAPRPQPAAHVPTMRIEHLPVLTRPLITDLAFDVASPAAGDASYWGDAGCAVDMDAAATAAACGANRACAMVIGLSSPAILRLPVDYESSLRRAWCETMIDLFATAAAANAAQVVRRIIERI